MLAISDQHWAISGKQSARRGLRRSSFIVHRSSFSFARIPHSPRPSPLVPRRSPRGFTLVELLVVITILAILASLMLFALAGAQVTAIEMRTRSTIAKLNAIITQKYESYRTRRVPVDVKLVAARRSYPATPQGWAHARLDVLRELMRMEMPDSFADIDNAPITKWADPAGGPDKFMPRTASNVAYQNSLPVLANRNNNAIGAKCLYLIVTKGCDDPDVMEQFAPSEIATDSSDNMKYFVDGWGNAISFLRWAPAFESPLQTANPTQRDPFDPLNAEATAYQPTFPLYPLIYSAGADGVLDIRVAAQDSMGNPVVMSYTDINNDPFYNGTTQTPLYDPSPNYDVLHNIGKRDSDGDGNDQSIDNITNHDIETR